MVAAGAVISVERQEAMDATMPAAMLVALDVAILAEALVALGAAILVETVVWLADQNMAPAAH